MIYKIVKKVLSPSGIARLERLINQVQRPLLLAVSWSKFLCSVYYTFCSGSFRREHQGVVRGRLQYMKDAKDPLATQYLLRRNTHRLEKGLLMRPRRDVFALDYIEDTVRCYERTIKARTASATDPDLTDLQWSSDVLARYFEVAGAHPTIDAARGLFHPLESKPQDRALVAAPYQRNLDDPPSVKYEELLELARRRRSVRWFLPKPVPRDLIDNAVTLAALSPSACNRQPFEFRIFDDAELVREVTSIPMGTIGYAENVPAIVVLVGKLRAYYSERDRHLIYIDASLAAMSFCLALETQDLSSCCINWPDVGPFEKQMTKLLGLEPDERIIMLIALGYPDPEGLVAYSQKKPLGELRSFNRVTTS